MSLREDLEKISSWQLENLLYIMVDIPDLVPEGHNLVDIYFMVKEIHAKREFKVDPSKHIYIAAKVAIDCFEHDPQASKDLMSIIANLSR